MRILIQECKKMLSVRLLLLLALFTVLFYNMFFELNLYPAGGQCTDSPYDMPYAAKLIRKYGSTLPVTEKGKIEKEVEELVKNIKGVNKAKVMITLKSSEERIVKEDNEVVVENDERETNKTGKESKKNNTVIVDGENGEQPYVVKELYPQVEGVAVCIKGNFDSEIKNNIISIIQALFDIESHKISVTEMK